MAFEIERRFLIKNDNWKKFINKKVYIEQGYFSKSLDGWIIRVRLIGKNSKITLKKHIKGFTNFEFEYSIPRSDAETIMSNLSHKIKKDRFFLEIEKKSWIIDCFKENNYPLEIAEIELSNEEEDLFLPSFISKVPSQRNHSSFIFSLYLSKVFFFNFFRCMVFTTKKVY